jgi:hypothetical protein
VASGLAPIGKKQIPRPARNDNSRGFGLGLTVCPGWVVEPAPHWSEDRPLHAERIRRSWEAGKCVAMGPVVGVGFEAGRAVGFGMVVERAEVEVGVIGAFRVWGRAGSGSRGCG